MFTLRKIYILLLAISILTTTASIYAMWVRPEFQILVVRTSSAIEASIEEEIARNVSPELLENRLHERLNEDKRNWVVIEAVKEMADERSIILSPELEAEYELAYEEDHDAWENAEDCAACLWDAKNCNLSPELICQGVAALSPVGDVTGIIRQSGNYVTGKPVDEFELVLSAVGLGAIVVVPLTGGASLNIKIGTALAKVARKMDLVTPKLMRSIKNSFNEAVHNKEEAHTFSAKIKDKYSKSLRSGSVTSIIDTLNSFGRMKESAGLLAALHLTRYVDNSLDARKLAKMTEVQKEKTVGVIELLGKNKTLKTVMRYSNEVWGLISGLAGITIAVICLMFKTILSLLMSGLRRAVRHKNQKITGKTAS